MLCQTIHVWITYIKPNVTYILCCYARPCLELITSNWWWRMSSLSHSSQWWMSSLSHSSPIQHYIFDFESRLCLLVRPLSGAITLFCICYIFAFERQTLSVSQTFVWHHYRFVLERQTLSASQTFVWRYYSILVHNLLGFGQIVFSQDSCIKALGLGLSLYPIICWPFLHCWAYLLAFFLIWVFVWVV